ncbi:hypothetical protein G7Z17_g3455 [Cylindrodendrum hubeiense]|uniref:Uncharacterized protein n=1 Tax=Cylindrodendrum hubeiense TaxID=595255 RepID=A0A9P5HFT6_9HYPO|nr:hypothetical protein G7Z17_g3455 [Cylindrodendrum hubeiense]
MNGVLALASAYDSKSSDATLGFESTYYHNRCIEFLIEAFARPPETWDAKLLTAVVIARLYEEYDNEADFNYHHLSGTKNLLNHEAVARFVMQGGLAEAASWVHLRQAIYVYVVHKKPVDICLENFDRSTVFQRTDDSAYTNRSVYLFAKLIKLLFPMDGSQAATGPQKEAWKLLEHEISSWNDSKPMSFYPVYSKPADLANGKPFPTIYIAASIPGKIIPKSFQSSYSLTCVKWLLCNITMPQRQSSAYTNVIEVAPMLGIMLPDFAMTEK